MRFLFRTNQSRSGFKSASNHNKKISMPPIRKHIFILLLIFSIQSANLRAEDGEKSDLSNVEFPPPFVPSHNPLIPAGHLNPFGLQKAANGPIKEYTEVLRPPEFWERHVRHNLPLVFRGGIKRSPAIQQWTDENLKLRYGDLDVLIEKKKENRTHGFTDRIRFADFLERYQKDNLYVVTVLPDPMRGDVQALPCLLCGTFREFLHETNFWMSSGGTRSVIHYDADHNLHCMVAGQKDFVMVDPKFADAFNVTRPAEFGSGYSPIDPDMIDLNLYPKIAQVEWTYARLGPGDCIYIPSGYIHQVRGYGRSQSVTTLFTASTNNTFESTGCEEQSFDYVSLNEVNIVWTYNKDDKFIAMGYMNVEKFREMLNDQIQEKLNGRMNAKEFSEFMEQVFPLEEEDEDILKRDTDEIFRVLLDTDMKGYITANSVKQLSKGALKEVISQCEAPHGPAQGDHKDEQGNKHAQRAEDKKLGHQEL